MSGKIDTIYYDGHCGLCHKWVRYVLHADPDGRLFRFSPLQGEHIRSALTDEQRQSLPDSVVLHTRDGQLFTRSDAIIHILDRLGGRHRRKAKLLRLLPRPLRDLGYRGVAAVRIRIWGRPAEACPMLPPHLRERFLP